MAARGCIWACLSGLAAAAAAPVTVFNLPAAGSLFEAGLWHGERAADHVRAFFATEEIARLLTYARSAEGKVALDSLRRASLEAAPWLDGELRGIAEGSGQDLDDIWSVNLMSELEYLEKAHGDHCSDVLGRDPMTGEVWHGHNEDWSLDFRPLVYFVVYNSGPAASFMPIGGLVYPGQAPGFAIAFTPHVWTTSNSLSPTGINTKGVGIVAMARAVIEGKTAEEVAQGYCRRGQAYGMNMQVVAHSPGRAYAADIESAGSADQVYLHRMDANMTHFNNYKYLTRVPADAGASSVHRQAAADRFAAPQSKEDVLAILGDTSDRDLPIYRSNNTMMTALFHSSTGRFWVWHASNPKESEPSWTSTLAEVFEASTPNRLLRIYA